MLNYKNYLKPEFISRLNSLDLQARFVVEGYLSGMHKSPYHGFSVEFTEYRPYWEGEPIRYLDWKKYAKSDRLVVREYEDNTNLSAYLLLDCSTSMSYASLKNTSKFQYSILLAASLAYLLIRQRDAVGVSLVGTGHEKFLYPKTSKSHLFQILSVLHNASAKGNKPLAQSMDRLSEKIHRKGLVILFSDCMEEPEQLLKGIKHLRFLGHEVIFFHILDPNELNFDFRSTSTFEDIETGEKLLLDPLKIRGTYRSFLKKHLNNIKSECLKQVVDYHLLTTDQPFDKGLTAFLQKRHRLS